MLLPTLVFHVGCGESNHYTAADFESVDALFAELVAGSASAEPVVAIDHARLALEAGAVMPPARVLLFSDPQLNTAILQLNPVAGLDLPYRALAYLEKGHARVAYTSAEFLQRRHQLPDAPALAAFDRGIQAALTALPAGVLDRVDGEGVTPALGMTTLTSNHDFDQTVKRLREAILTQGDTVWFGDIDYTAQARVLGVTLPRLSLLLFGGPGPGGKAMADFPRMGLDAFCQKVLVHELPDGSIKAYFNQMPAFARLHYGDRNLPQVVINFRMGQTLSGAME
jgi:uncharacterized protein (DUF302 family)